MPTISGSLNLVTDRPVDSISEVWVRARETRGQGDGLTVGVNDRVPVTDGAVEFTALPGAAVLVLVQNGIPIETHPMLITDEPQQSLRAVIQTIQIADSADQQILEQLSAEVAADAARAGKYRVEAAAARDDAQAAATTASNAARIEVARVVDGAPEDLDTIREVAEYAQNNRDITDQLNAAIGNKADKTHSHPISQVTGLQSELDSRPSMQTRWTYCGRTDSDATNWVFTPISVPGAPKLSNSDQRINANVSGIWEIRLTCTDPNRQVEIFTPKGSDQGTGSCFMIATLTASDYITSYRYGAVDDTKIVVNMTKLD